jgi:hypothetical protein
VVVVPVQQDNRKAQTEATAFLQQLQLQAVVVVVLQTAAR